MLKHRFANGRFTYGHLHLHLSMDLHVFAAAKVSSHGGCSVNGQQAERADPGPGRPIAKSMSVPGESTVNSWSIFKGVCKKSYYSINTPHATVGTRYMLGAGDTVVTASAKPDLVLLPSHRRDVWLQRR